MATTYPLTVDSFDTHVDNVDDVMAADVNSLNDAVVAIETYTRAGSLIVVKNTSGSTVAANDVGYINYAGEFKTTTTAYYLGAWCVVISGAANNSDIIVARRGRVTVELNGNCSAGNYLYTSTTATRAQPESYVRPEVFAVALTANSSGAGGTCSALLLCNSDMVHSTGAQKIYNAASLSDSDFVATIATLPGGAVLTYNAPGSGDEANLVPTSTSQWAKMVLANTTRSNDALISDCVIGTNTITLTANVPGTWQVGDTITIRSQTNTDLVGASYFVEFELTGLETLTRTISAEYGLLDTGGASAWVQLHPYKAGVSNLRMPFYTQSTQVIYLALPDLPIINNRFCAVWNATGANTLTFDVRLIDSKVAIP